MIRLLPLIDIHEKYTIGNNTYYKYGTGLATGLCVTRTEGISCCKMENIRRRMKSRATPNISILQTVSDAQYQDQAAIIGYETFCSVFCDDIASTERNLHGTCNI